MGPCEFDEVDSTEQEERVGGRCESAASEDWDVRRRALRTMICCSLYTSACVERGERALHRLVKVEREPKARRARIRSTLSALGHRRTRSLALAKQTSNTMAKKTAARRSSAGGDAPVKLASPITTSTTSAKPLPISQASDNESDAEEDGDLSDEDEDEDDEQGDESEDVTPEALERMMQVRPTFLSLPLVQDDVIDKSMRSNSFLETTSTRPNWDSCPG
jgi:hypothetical protein